MLYKGDKDVSDAARPPEGGLAEVGGLSASSLPLMFDARPVRMPDDLAKKSWVAKPKYGTNKMN